MWDYLEPTKRLFFKVLIDFHVYHLTSISQVIIHHSRPVSPRPNFLSWFSHQSFPHLSLIQLRWLTASSFIPNTDLFCGIHRRYARSFWDAFWTNPFRAFIMVFNYFDNFSRRVDNHLLVYANWNTQLSIHRWFEAWILRPWGLIGNVLPQTSSPILSTLTNDVPGLYFSALKLRTDGPLSNEERRIRAICGFVLQTLLKRIRWKSHFSRNISGATVTRFSRGNGAQRTRWYFYSSLRFNNFRIIFLVHHSKYFFRHPLQDHCFHTRSAPDARTPLRFVRPHPPNEAVQMITHPTVFALLVCHCLECRSALKTKGNIWRKKSSSSQ